ncbi:hypothetical protein ACFY1U_16660 [Streptomyces sp. NPDC001351]|uniref:hypothetical protein n=1 Tax=Streptomyces sp. NPDC001351 TaxID=3364564 RepID=UPI0036C611E4
MVTTVGQWTPSSMASTTALPKKNHMHIVAIELVSSMSWKSEAWGAEAPRRRTGACLT